MTALDYDATSQQEANKGDYIDLRLNPEFVIPNLTEVDKEYCAFYGVDSPLEAATKRVNQTAMHEGYMNLLPAETPTNISRIMTQVEDYMKQEVPVMVMSATQEEYEAKFAEIQTGLSDLGYDDVMAYYKEAWAKAIRLYDDLTGGKAAD